MANEFTLNDQAEIIRNILRWKRRQFTAVQIAQLEAAERTLFGLKALRESLAAVEKEEVDSQTDQMAEELIDLLQLQRA
jgi:acyl-[acyl carrier protein]--UDP-N-acetylglucosamine O-acyltransferase